MIGWLVFGGAVAMVVCYTMVFALCRASSFDLPEPETSEPVCECGHFKWEHGDPEFVGDETYWEGACLCPWCECVAFVDDPSRAALA